MIILSNITRKESILDMANKKLWLKKDGVKNKIEVNVNY